MKAMVLGVIGVGATGGAVYMGGAPAVDDYVAIIHKSPEQVFQAFSALAPEGEQSAPVPAGAWAAPVKARVTKVQNQSLQYQVLIEGSPLATVDIQVAPAEGNATRLAAEVDVDTALLGRLVREAGGELPPGLPLGDSLIDYGFAQVMAQAAQQIEAGQPLQSLASGAARWGSNRAGSARPMTTGVSWQQPARVRPQASARPAVDPGSVAREHAFHPGASASRPPQSGGW